MRILVTALLLCLTAAANAADLTIQWQIPTQACDGTPIPAADLTNIEVYVSDQPIPGPGAGETGCEATTPPPPAGYTPTVVPATDGTVTIQVDGGKTYYARARVQHISGEWSGLSNQGQQTVPLGRIQPPSVLIIPLGG